MDFVEKVKLFNDIAGTKEVFEKRKALLYVGLVLEEVAELLTSIKFTPETSPAFEERTNQIEALGNMFKSSVYDMSVADFDKVEFLDACVDISVVALGGGISIGANIMGACHNVANSNLSKFPFEGGQYVVYKDENGKVKKPPSFVKPDLAQFLK